jgi:hypothetical protein
MMSSFPPAEPTRRHRRQFPAETRIRERASAPAAATAFGAVREEATSRQRCVAAKLRYGRLAPRLAQASAPPEGSPMPFSISQSSLPVFEIGLNALSGVLDKAEAFAAAKKIDPSVLVAWRLAPDMFALARQVQIAADQAKNGSARLAGIEPPRYEDDETTIDELKARLAKTIAFLKTLDAQRIDASADREIAFPLGPNNTGRMKGDDYLNHFVLPNFYFHLTAAYAVLRQCGIELGKRDFLGAIPLTMS